MRYVALAILACLVVGGCSGSATQDIRVGAAQARRGATIMLTETKQAQDAIRRAEVASRSLRQAHERLELIRNELGGAAELLAARLVVLRSLVSDIPAAVGCVEDCQAAVGAIRDEAQQVGEVVNVVADATEVLDSAVSEATGHLETAQEAAGDVQTAAERVEAAAPHVEDVESAWSVWAKRTGLLVVVALVVVGLIYIGAGRITRPVCGAIGDWIYRKTDREAVLAAKLTDGRIAPEAVVAAMRGAGGKRFQRTYRQARQRDPPGDDDHGEPLVTT